MSYILYLLMKNIIKNKKTLSKQNFTQDTKKFSKLYVKDIEHRAQSARSTYFGERSTMAVTRPQIFIFDANVGF